MALFLIFIQKKNFKKICLNKKKNHIKKNLRKKREENKIKSFQ